MRTSKCHVALSVIASLGFVGCAPDVPSTNELTHATSQPLDSSSAWRGMTSMLSKRTAHAVLKLSDGRVLAVGGTTNASEAAEYFDTTTNSWTRITVPDSVVITAQGNSCRPAMAQNKAGQVIIVTGDSIVLFDPSKDAWTPDVFKFSFTTCAPLAIATNNDILILADAMGDTHISPFLYSANNITTIPDLPNLTDGNWQGLSAIRLKDDRVLVSGGTGNNVTAIYDASSPNTWSTAGMMFYRRSYHAMALLPNGAVLAAGGLVVSDANDYRNNAAEIFDPDTLEWKPTTSMLSLRSGDHTATSLESGFVLVIGGSVSSTAELYDPSVESWTAIESPDDARFFNHTATLLDNGSVLVTGGVLNEASDQVASCDALAFAWQQRTTLLADSRAYHSATKLSDDTLLVVGGAVIAKNAYINSLQDAWLYDATNDSWTQKTGPSVIHEFHAAVKLQDGGVLIAGGTQSPFAEIFDASANTWSSVDSADYSSNGLISSILLSDGRVLLLGALSAKGAAQSALLYDPKSKTFSSETNLPDGVVIGPGHSATLLSDDRVFVAGGFPVCPVDMTTMPATNTALIYDPSANTWTVTKSMPTAAGFHSATLLSDGRVLIAGGGGDIGGSCLTPSWSSIYAGSAIYDPDSDAWIAAQALNEARSEHQAILLASNEVLVVGGRRNSQNRILSTAEIFNPTDKSWTTTSRLRFGRYGHSLTSLNGGIIAVGGVQPYSMNTTTAERFPQAELGNVCTLDEQCKSGYCASGVCCNSACNSQCLSCSSAQSPKKVLPDGTCEDVSGCAPYACESETGVCGKTCSSVTDCAIGYVCDPSSACIDPLPNASVIDESSCAANAPAQSNAPPWPAFSFIACAFLWRRQRSRRIQRKL